MSKFLIGAAVGAVGGFAVGAFAATPTARSASQSAIGGIDVSARFLGKAMVHAVDVLGREKYLEHEIEELREQITRLEQRMD